MANHTRLRQITRSMPTSNKQGNMHFGATPLCHNKICFKQLKLIESSIYSIKCMLNGQHKDQDSQRSTCFRKFDQCCSQCEICPGSYLGYASGKRDQILTKTGERRALCFLVGVHHQQSGTEGYSIDGIGGKMLYNAVCLLIVYDIYIYICIIVLLLMKTYPVLYIYIIYIYILYMYRRHRR